MSKLDEYLADVKQVAGDRYQDLIQCYDFEIAYQDRVKVEDAIQDASVAYAMRDVD